MVQPHPALDFPDGRFCFCRMIAHFPHRLSLFDLELLVGQMNLTAPQNSLRLIEPEAVD